MDLTEAEDTKKRWQEYTEELYKKDHHNPDNHDGVITHLEPDILEYKVKWALRSFTMNKASGGDEITVELDQVLKNDAVKVLHSVWWQIWKTQQWPQDWKRSVFLPVPKKGNAKECSRYQCTMVSVNLRIKGLPCGPVVKSLPADAGILIQSLVWEESTCHWARKPVATPTETRTS